MISITIYGHPAPQGSKKFVGKSKAGHAIMVESSKKVPVWREAVKEAALRAMQAQGSSMMIGPICAEMTFVMPRPKSAKKNAMASTRPDLSKLIRSTEDALTDVGVWEDDARVVECTARKVFAGDPRGLGVPGAILRIWSSALIL